MEKVYSKEEALKLSDGTRLVIYRGVLANGGDCFSVDKILFGTRRGKINRITIDDLDITFALDEDRVVLVGSLSQKTVAPALATSEGQEFRGWKRTKQYRLTKDEIAELVAGKIFNGSGYK